jgi:hypothetical protein
MNMKMEIPAALAGADGEGIETRQFHPPQYIVRKEWAIAAWFALDHCDHDDALHICERFISEATTGGPVLGDAFGMVVSDARLWADCAPAHELAAYAGAAMGRLGGRGLHLNVRKRLFADLWQAFPKAERLAFLSRIDAEGRFLQKGVAQ